MKPPDSVRTSAWNKISTIATVIMATIALIGIILLIAELNQLRDQNVILNRSLTQTYRPVGVAIRTRADTVNVPVKIQYQYHMEDRTDRFSFFYKPVLTNYGGGILRYIGHIYYLSPEYIDFRSAFIGGSVLNPQFDGLSAYARGIPLGPGEKLPCILNLEDVSFADVYFLYCLFLYQDQEGNLYDTEHMVHLRFQDPQLVDNRLLPKLREFGGGQRERYHQYSKDEQKLLVASLRELKHPIADALDYITVE